MRSPKNIILAAATAALAISALGAPVSAADGQGHLAIVNGIPGQKVDFCLNGKKIKSGVRYGGKKTLTVSPGRKVLRIHKKAPGKCKGAQLGKRVFRLEAFKDFTFVATRKQTAKQPNKIVRFRNTDLGSLPTPSPISGVLAVRHAADIGRVVFRLSIGEEFLAPSVIPFFVKGEQVKRLYSLGAHQFWATRIGKMTPIAGVFPYLASGKRYQFILVGTNLKNARFVKIEQSISLT